MTATPLSFTVVAHAPSGELMPVSPFHAYPPPPESHPLRPWWRYRRVPGSDEKRSSPMIYLWHAVRADGLVLAAPHWWAPLEYALTDEGRGQPAGYTQGSRPWSMAPDGLLEQLSEIDHEQAMPLPPVAGGQVWVLRAGLHIGVIAIDRSGVGITLDPYHAGKWAQMRPYPPLDAVLVHGPGSPWVPRGYEIQVDEATP